MSEKDCSKKYKYYLYSYKIISLGYLLYKVDLNTGYLYFSIDGGWKLASNKTSDRCFITDEFEISEEEATLLILGGKSDKV